MMENNNNRRRFFKSLFSSASDFLNTLAPSVTDPGAQGGGAEMTSPIMGDLTPELMAMEASRLGLDPQKDQDRVLQSIQAAMGGPAMKENSG